MYYSVPVSLKVRSVPARLFEDSPAFALRSFYGSFRQNFIFSYRDDTYDVTHAAKACPVDIKTTSVNNIIKGIGLDPYRMSKTTDLEWSKNNSMYSIHGHSNVENEPIHNTERTFNLCDSVEFGGNLRILKLS